MRHINKKHMHEGAPTPQMIRNEVTRAEQILVRADALAKKYTASAYDALHLAHDRSSKS